MVHVWTVGVISNSTRSVTCGSLIKCAFSNLTKCQGVPKGDIWMGLYPRVIAFQPSRLTDYTINAVACTALGTTACSKSMCTDIFFNKFWDLLCVVAVRVGHTSVRICGLVIYDSHCSYVYHTCTEAVRSNSTTFSQLPWRQQNSKFILKNISAHWFATHSCT